MGFTVPAATAFPQVHTPTRIVAGAIIRGGETVGGGPMACIQADRYVLAHRQRALVADVREQAAVGTYATVFEHALFKTSPLSSGSLVITIDAEAIATTLTAQFTLTDAGGTTVSTTLAHAGARGLTTLTWTPGTVWAADTWLSLKLEIKAPAAATHYALTMLEASLAALP